MRIQAYKGRFLNQNAQQNLNRPLTLRNPEFDCVFPPQSITTVIISNTAITFYKVFNVYSKHCVNIKSLHLHKHSKGSYYYYSHFMEEEIEV